MVATVVLLDGLVRGLDVAPAGEVLRALQWPRAVR
jgi:hypothetical protein